MKKRNMRRSKELLAKRKEFIKAYVADNSDKQMKIVIEELTERLFISEATIYGILRQD